MNDSVNPKGKAISAENWCHTSMQVHYCSYIWTIHKFCEYYVSNGFIDSSAFKSTTNDKYEWILRLSEPDTYTFVNATIFMRVEDDKLGQDTLIKCKISIIDGKGEETHLRELSHYQKFDKYVYDTTKISPPFYYKRTFANFFNAGILNEILLKNDTLTVYCEVRFITQGSNKFMISSKNFIVHQVKDGGLPEDMARLLENKDFSDFTISINGVKYPVHKTILAARSEVFASMLKHEMKERNHNCVEIQDIDQNVFEEMLHFMYTGKSPNLDYVSCDLLAAAEKYDLKHLKTMCELSLIKMLSIEGVVDSLILADTYHAALLKQEAIQFIKTHITDVKRTKTWIKIKRSDLFGEVFDALFP